MALRLSAFIVANTGCLANGAFECLGEETALMQSLVYDSVVQRDQKHTKVHEPCGGGVDQGIRGVDQGIRGVDQGIRGEQAAEAQTTLQCDLDAGQKTAIVQDSQGSEHGVCILEGSQGDDGDANPWVLFGDMDHMSNNFDGSQQVGSFTNGVPDTPRYSLDIGMLCNGSCSSAFDLMIQFGKSTLFSHSENSFALTDGSFINNKHIGDPAGSLGEHGMFGSESSEDGYFATYCALNGACAAKGHDFLSFSKSAVFPDTAENVLCGPYYNGGWKACPDSDNVERVRYFIRSPDLNVRHYHPVPSAPYIKNGDFEDNEFSGNDRDFEEIPALHGWTSVGTVQLVKSPNEAWGNVENPALSGQGLYFVALQNSAYLSGDTTWASVKQSVSSFVSGRSYKLTFLAARRLTNAWQRNNSWSASTSLKVSVGDIAQTFTSEFPDSLQCSPGDCSKFTMTFVAHSSTMDVKFENQGTIGDHSFFLDSIEITEVEEED